jgi:hypothetical protein
MFLDKEDIDKKAFEIQLVLDRMKADTRFEYDDPSHIYKWENKKVPSVSSFVHRFAKPFDEYEKSKKKSLQLGVSQDEVLEMWADTRDNACADGHEVHSFAEHEIQGYNPPLPGAGRPLELIMEYLDIRKKHMQNIRCLGAEVRMFSKTLNLAGTADLLLQDTQTGDIILGDWKTNKKFKSYGGYNKLGWPLLSIYENHLTKYSIQLTLYKMMLKENGINTDKAIIIHIAEDTGKSQFFEAIDFTAKISEYLKVFGPL